MSEPVLAEPRVEDLRLRNQRGQAIAATLYLPGDQAGGGRRTPGLLVGHGAGSNRHRHDRFCRQACRKGLAVLSIDFRGHGESEGLLDGPAEEDILAAVGFLRQDPRLDGTRLGYRGSSMGGYYGLRAASRAGFAALALLCPATEPVLLEALGDTRGSGERNEEGVRFRFDADALREYLLINDVYADASELSCPVLLVHARGDRVVPLESSLQLDSRLAGPTEVVILPGGAHSTAQSSGAVHGRVAAWLADRLSEQPSA